MIRYILLSVTLFTIACAAPLAGAGEACVEAEGCASGRCEISGSFPGGICVVGCDQDSDCPDGFACISRSSGICLKRCAESSECEAQRGSEWQCRDESLEDGDGNVMVCIGA